MKNISKIIFSLIVFTLFLNAVGKLPQKAILVDDATIKFNIIQPTPTCVEKNFGRIVPERSSRVDEKSKYFLVKGYSMVVDRNGYVFVFDLTQYIILKFDPYLNCIGAFAKEGQGPGELGRFGTVGIINLSMSGSSLLVGDRANRKIIRYDLIGKTLEEIKLRIDRPFGFVPLESPNGYFYIHATGKSLLDVFNKKGEKVGSVLTENELHNSLFMRPQGDSKYLSSAYRAVDFGFVGNSTLALYVRRSGTLYLWKDQRLLKKIHLWPKKGLELYQKEIVAFKKRVGSAGSLAFGHMLIDEDDPEHIFVQALTSEKEKSNMVYCYDLMGKLIKTYVVQPLANGDSVSFRYIRKKRFYGIGFDEQDNEIVVSYKIAN